MTDYECQLGMLKRSDTPFELGTWWKGKTIIIKDNAEVVFYFDKDEKLTRVRAYD